MQDERKIILDLIRKQKDCEFSLRSLLHKEETAWKNIFTILTLVKKGREEVSHDYGEHILMERLLEIDEGIGIISNLYPEKQEDGTLTIAGYGEFKIGSKGRIHFASSKKRSGILKYQWPAICQEFEVQPAQKGRGANKELLRTGLSYYPSVNDAIIDFFELAVDHFNSYGAFYVTVVDYRARIEFLKISFSKAELKLDSPELEHQDLVVKVFAKSGLEMATLPDIYPTSEFVRFDVGFQPDNLSAVLLSRRDGMKIDEKEFAKWRGEEEGIIIERPEEEIVSLSRVGEGQNLEYKGDIDDKNKNDFIETVIAFLNTNSGLILIGVDDEGGIIGSRRKAEDIRKLIHDSCDPPPRGIKVDEMLIDGNTIIIVEIPEGDDPPYQSKRDKNFYVRHSANDMRMERSELLAIMKEQESAYEVDS